MPEATQELDARGLNCPLPIIRMKKALQDLSQGEVLKIAATDPGANRDVESYCTQSESELLEATQEGDTYIFYIKKG